MAAFAKTPPCHPCGLGLVLIHRNDFDTAAIYQKIKLAAACLAFPAFDDDGGFQQIRSGQ